jgi:hypothetical protein
MRNLFALACFALFFACQPAEKADFLFYNGTIYTMTTPGATVEALAISGECILYAGLKKEAEKFKGERTQMIDLQEKTLLPGFTDSHVHPVSGGLSLLECDLTGVENPDTILAMLERFAKKHPEKTWIRGENWWLPSFPGGNPHKSLLDKIIPDRPVFVSSADGHSAWVNSKALEMAGVGAETADPAHGRIERDARTKEPSGTLREDAMGLVSNHIPEYSHKERVAALKEALKMANSLGITNLVEASAREGYIEAYLDLAKKGELTAHVSISIYGDISKGMEGVKTVLEKNRKYTAGTPLPDVRFNQVKFFMDGVVEGKTAAMLDNYADEPQNGIANATPEVAKEIIAAIDRAGLQVHVHAIGDRGIRQTLDAFEFARKTNGKRDARHHIAHLHLIHPDDIGRFRELDVIANFQALWATLEDSYMTDMNFPFLGKERSEWQYPFGTVAKTGAHLVFGSDWPVSTMNPFHAAQVAITRRGPDSLALTPWTPQHLLELPAVVEGYIKGGAYLTFLEKETGTLEAGKLADLVILDRDVFSLKPFEVIKTQVTMTLFRGKVVYKIP